MVWFLSEMKAARHQEMKAARHQEMELVTGFPLSFSLPQMLCWSTFRNSPLPSAVYLKVDCSVEQMLLRFCQQSSAQPQHRQLDNGFRKAGWGWWWGCALISLFASLVPEMVVHCHSQSKTYLGLIWEKGMGFSYLLFKDTQIQKPGKAAVYTKMPSTGKLQMLGVLATRSALWLLFLEVWSPLGYMVWEHLPKDCLFHDFLGEGVSGFPSYMLKQIIVSEPWARVTFNENSCFP